MQESYLFLLDSLPAAFGVEEERELESALDPAAIRTHLSWLKERLSGPYGFAFKEVARNDPYFIERNLYPNVDFYSGIIYQEIGIPTNMFTVMFAMGRMPG